MVKFWKLEQVKRSDEGYWANDLELMMSWIG